MPHCATPRTRALRTAAAYTLTLALIASLRFGVVAGTDFTVGTPIDLVVNAQPISFTQSTQVQEFHFVITDRTQHANLYVRMQNTGVNRALVQTDPPLLMAGIEYNPQVQWWQGSEYYDAQYADFNGQSLNKLKQYINFTPFHFSMNCYMYGDCNVYVLFYVPTDLSRMMYEIGVQQRPYAYCPNDCSGQMAICSENGECACPRGRIDEDCSVSAKKLSVGESQTVTLSQSSLKYAYFTVPNDWEQSMDTAVLTVTLSGNAQGLMYIGAKYLIQTTVPNAEQYVESVDITSTTDFTLPNEYLYFDSGQPRTVIFALQSISGSGVECTFEVRNTRVQESTTDSGTVNNYAKKVYIAVGVSVGGFLLFAVILGLCWRRLARFRYGGATMASSTVHNQNQQQQQQQSNVIGFSSHNDAQTRPSAHFPPQPKQQYMPQVYPQVGFVPAPQQYQQPSYQFQYAPNYSPVPVNGGQVFYQQGVPYPYGNDGPRAVWGDGGENRAATPAYPWDVQLQQDNNAKRL